MSYNKVTIKTSTKPEKKLMAIFTKKDSNRTKTVSFFYPIRDF